MTFVPPLAVTWEVFGVLAFLLFLMAMGGLIMLVKLYQKVDQGTALVRNGMGGTRVSFSGMLVFPVIHRAERMDISVKRIEIYRHGSEGLICMDNIRADIKVAFFVRVNKTMQDVMQVAQLLGCERASEERALVELFDAGFGEQLVLGMDSGYCSESCAFTRITFLPDPPFYHFFERVLPAFRNMGMTAAMEEQMLVTNPRRIIPIQ